MSSAVADFYKNKTVLLTGGTGYFGKMIIEKLLRTTEVKNIYLIVRGKQDIDFEKRVTKMFEEQIFFRIPETLFMDKVHPIEGDLKKRHLGISKKDITFLRENINMVFHCGASLNMDAKLEEAVMTNVHGTAEILDLMKGSQIIEAFILVSTAYSNCLNPVIEEKFYDPPINPKLLIKIVQEMHPDLLNNISKGIVGKWPNTYTFTKAVSEHLLLSEGNNMPVALFRPTIVTSTVSDPMEGWSDNLYGPLGILLSSNCGILRVIRGNPGIKADTVPGDLVINGLLCQAWEVATQWKADISNYKPSVINFSGNGTPLYVSIREYTSIAEKCGYIPFKRTVWNPMLFIIDNKWLFQIVKFFLHTTPAYLFDGLLMISGRKPQMGKIYAKLDKVMTVLHYFLVQEWTIKNDNSKALLKKLSEQDRAVYNFDFGSLQIKTYLKNLMLGLKKYTLKEDMSKSQHHTAKYQRLVVLHGILKYLCLYFISYSVLMRLAKLLRKSLSRLKTHHVIL